MVTVQWKFLEQTAMSRCEDFYTNPPAHPEDVDRVSPRNVRKTPYLDTAVCPRKFHWILSHLESFKTVTVATSATVTTIIANADLNVSAVIIDEWTYMELLLDGCQRS
jgi:hypothetical protein